MKTIKVWMEYSAKSEIEVEVEDDFDADDYLTLEDWPVAWLKELDESVHEFSPEDWGIREA